jgi:hypothetical protein
LENDPSLIGGTVIFVARYKDGSCALVDGVDEAEARELAQSEAAWFKSGEDEIVSLRPLAAPFVSRWFFEDIKSKELIEIDRLSD